MKKNTIIKNIPMNYNNNNYKISGPTQKQFK